MEKQKSQKDDKERPNQISYQQWWYGADKSYYTLAIITRDPTPEGLHGGHIHFFNILKLADMTDKAHYLGDIEEPDVQLARYEGGELTRYVDDPLLNEVIEKLKAMYSSERVREDDERISWLDMAEELPSRHASRAESAKTDPANFESALKKAAEREADRRREQDHAKEQKQKESSWQKAVMKTATKETERSRDRDLSDEFGKVR